MDDSPPHRMDEDSKPKPASSTTFPPDYSDVASNDSQDDSKGRRRYERGGRKNSTSHQHIDSNTTPSTGIRAFNIRRAKDSGGRRPFNVTVEDPTKESKSKSKPKPKSKNKPNNEEDDPDIDDEEDEEDEEEGEKGRQAEENKEEKQKPLSIRLDLNLELEIFLKAKIKGDITITFLE